MPDSNLDDPDVTPVVADEDEDDDEDGTTPFDHPLFLPVLLFLGSLWFIRDGWFNPEMEWVKFNRYGSFVMLALTIATTRSALIEMGKLGKGADSPENPQD